MDKQTLKNIVEAILLATDKIMDLGKLEAVITTDDFEPTRNDIKDAILALQADYAGRGMELKEVASGFRFQVRQDYADYIARLWEEKPAKYSRALLETLVLIAYRQPITRGEIESIRGVSVSSHIVKTLLEREWVRVVGHRDVPGKPSIYGTTREFLDYFNLKSLDDLPPLADIKDLDNIAPELALAAEEETSAAEDTAAEEQAAETGEEPQPEIEADEEIDAEAYKDESAEADLQVEPDLEQQSAEDSDTTSPEIEQNEAEAH